jgi:hypothetical protein
MADREDTKDVSSQSDLRANALPERVALAQEQTRAPLVNESNVSFMADAFAVGI